MVWAFRDLPEWETFLRRVREGRGSSWWAARDELRETDWEGLHPIYRPQNSSHSLGRLLSHSVGTWTKELCVEGRGGGNRAMTWRVLTLDEVLRGVPLPA